MNLSHGAELTTLNCPVDLVCTDNARESATELVYLWKDYVSVGSTENVELHPVHVELSG